MGGVWGYIGGQPEGRPLPLGRATDSTLDLGRERGHVALEGTRMGIDTISKTHVETAKIGTRKIAEELTQALGPTVVAVLAGVRDRKLPGKWAKKDGPTPRDESIQRLQAAHRIWKALSEDENPEVAKLWFIGLNPLLEEKPPMVALNEGRIREVLEAARAFLEDDRSE
jgi:hypothetical protein